LKSKLDFSLLSVMLYSFFFFLVHICGLPIFSL